jgi:hypothetical protein
MRFQTGDLLVLKTNKALKNEPDWFSGDFPGAYFLSQGSVVLVLSDNIEGSFIKVATSVGDGWIYKESLEKIN